MSGYIIEVIDTDLVRIHEETASYPLSRADARGTIEYIKANCSQFADEEAYLRRLRFYESVLSALDGENNKLEQEAVADFDAWYDDHRELIESDFLARKGLARLAWGAAVLKASARASRLQFALRNLLAHVEMIQVSSGFEIEAEMEPFNIKAAIKQAADALGRETLEELMAEPGADPSKTVEELAAELSAGPSAVDEPGGDSTYTQEFDEYSDADPGL